MNHRPRERLGVKPSVRRRPSVAFHSFIHSFAGDRKRPRNDATVRSTRRDAIDRLTFRRRSDGSRTVILSSPRALAREKKTPNARKKKGAEKGGRRTVSVRLPESKGGASVSGAMDATTDGWGNERETMKR